jgi:hypothetical protein
MASPQNFGPIPFRFNPLWMHNATTILIVKEAWKTPIQGCPIFVLESKLQAVKSALKSLAKLSYSSKSGNNLENVGFRNSPT